MVAMAEFRGKKALPHEVSDDLVFASLIDVLRILEGENVCLVLAKDRREPAPVIRAYGRLRTTNLRAW